LNLFARNYYLCTDDLEKDTMDIIQAREAALSADGYNGSVGHVSSKDILGITLLLTLFSMAWSLLIR